LALVDKGRRAVDVLSSSIVVRRQYAIVVDCKPSGAAADQKLESWRRIVAQLFKETVGRV
jgi:hypothetical protein